jgi:hypothetical protein
MERRISCGVGTGEESATSSTVGKIGEDSYDHKERDTARAHHSRMCNVSCSLRLQSRHCSNGGDDCGEGKPYEPVHKVQVRKIRAKAGSCVGVDRSATGVFVRFFYRRARPLTCGQYRSASSLQDELVSTFCTCVVRKITTTEAARACHCPTPTLCGVANAARGLIIAQAHGRKASQ